MLLDRCVNRKDGIDMEGSSSVEYFIELTKNAYGGSTIRKLEEATASSFFAFRGGLHSNLSVRYADAIVTYGRLV